MQNWRKNKKVRLGIIIGLIVVAGAMAFFFEKLRIWFIVIVVILLGALGMEVANTDYDLGKIISGDGIENSKVLRNKEGNIVEFGSPEASSAKTADEYNCDDFSNKKEAQRFFTNVGGPSKDTNRLDGDKDGEACESLPLGVAN
jgi:hypothetical protein